MNRLRYNPVKDCCICRETRTKPFIDFVHKKAHNDSYTEAHAFASEKAYGNTIEEFTENYLDIVTTQYEKLYKRSFKEHFKKSCMIILNNICNDIDTFDLVLFICDKHFDDYINQPPPPSVLALPVHAFLEDYPLHPPHTSS